MKKILLASLILLVCIAPGGEAIITFNEYNTITIENEIYHFNGTTEFSHVTIDDTWVQFNGTRFAIQSPNWINITIEFLNTSIADATQGDEVLNFTANCTGGGKVWFNLSGFTAEANYTINASGTYYVNITANASGWISFNYSTWSGNTTFSTTVRTPPSLAVYIPRPQSRIRLPVLLSLLASCIPFIIIWRKMNDRRGIVDTKAD